MMKKVALLAVVVVAPLIAAVSAQPPADRAQGEAGAGAVAEEQRAERAVRVEYLEIVTPAVDETCKALEGAHGVTFSAPVAALGNARTAELRGGGRIGVRAPMRETEAPVVRPYVLVEDIDAAVKAAVEAGAQVAMAPMELPGQGTFAIYVLGGIDHGLWQIGERRR